MKEETIQKVSNILNIWNPLGEKASTVEDLDGYRTEAIDILSTYSFFPGMTVHKAVKSVIEGAFEITVDESGLNDAVEKISKIIDK